MEIVCKKCRHPNKLGAIFCRECGSRLELAEITPETLRKKLNPPRFPWAKVIGVIIALALIFLLYMLFVPSGWEMPQLPETDKENIAGAQSLDGNLDAVLKSNKSGTIKGKPEWFSLLLTEIADPDFKLEEGAAADPVPRMVLKLEDDNSTLELYLRTKQAGFLPIFMKQSYVMKEGEFVFDSMTIGKVTVPPAAADFSRKLFLNCVPMPEEMRSALPRIESTKLDKDSRLVVKLKAVSQN